MRQLLIACFCLGLSSDPLAAGETYDLMFKAGALDQLAAASQDRAETGGLEYQRVTFGSLEGPGQASYRLDLRLAPQDSVALTLRQGDKTRGIGTFPASVGNPVIMYFMETTLRDMAGLSGGSPFYIRNRLKAALLQDAEILPVEVQVDGRVLAARQITLHPFAQDAARDRMGRFADLTLVVTVSDEVPGWYHSLQATAPADAGQVDNHYANAITFTARTEDGQ